MEHVKSSMVPSRDCLPPTNLYCLVCGSWGLYLRDTNNFQLFFPPPVKRLLLLQTFSFLSHKHLCCECAAHDGFSAMFLFLNKERLVDSSQPLNDDLSLKMLFVSLWYIFLPTCCQYLGLKSCILPIISSFLFLYPFRLVLSRSLAFGKKKKK